MRRREDSLMASLLLVIAVTAFLAGAATAVFAMIVIGIRKVDRPRHRITSAQPHQLFLSRPGRH
jgi:hypothetical protein